ncbi:hypothetical protein V0288_08780 [Pannus brasiliensis CCIBt3594]|uniref:Uncharacterized protein n=1 Tax=Pannus brasiliensis CCIBt3594 TaxID=1427578 RepID=A0AAW9QV02_9CHRO
MLEPKDYIPIVGWIVTFILGLISGGIIIPRLTRKRKILAWAVMSESDLIPRELSKDIGLPVVLQVGNYNPDSLSVVKLRFGSAGNDVVEKITIAIYFQASTHIIDARPIRNLREYGKGVQWNIDKNSCNINVAFINPGKSFEFEFILSNHEQGVIDVQAPAPGLEIQRTSSTVWDVEIHPLIARSIGLNLFGISVDPTAIAMNQIADELRSIRKLLTKP